MQNENLDKIYNIYKDIDFSNSKSVEEISELKKFQERLKKEQHSSEKITLELQLQSAALEKLREIAQNRGVSIEHAGNEAITLYILELKDA